MFPEYDVIVVGAGHAGCEAAAAAATMGGRVILITMDMTKIAQMSCNPAMGGVAKGQIVREIDALGGYSGIVSDRTAIQFRMLNRSKGPAMWSPRTQNDRMMFSQAWRETLEAVGHNGEPAKGRAGRTADNAPLPVRQGQRIDFWQDMVGEILVSRTFSSEHRVTVQGVRTGLGVEIRGKTVILTNGTFLNGIIHIGEKQFGGGRAGERAATGITEQLVGLGFRSGRMKTGTPPRVDGRSLDYSRMEQQPGDEDPSTFSFLPDTSPFGRKLSDAGVSRETTNEQRPPGVSQRSCHITYTSPEVHDILKTGFDRSPMFSGRISGTGPRYCPSIEDKINRFSERERHQLFVEPEGWNTVEVYVNGFSTSLPEEVQYTALRKVPGFEDVRMFRPGYAIEYDYFPPDQLELTLETKLVKNLFFAGQINGTTGYEEAACQGLMAGINAVCMIRDEGTVILGRDEAYIGVLIDDLINKGTDEPYRMFTSRAEHRILLRQDNADIRLTPLGHRLGLASSERNERAKAKRETVDHIIDILQEISVSPEEVNQMLEQAGTSAITQAVKALALMMRPQVTLSQLVQEVPALHGIHGFEREFTEQAEIQIKYASYIEKEHEMADRIQRLEGVPIASSFDFSGLQALSAEAREKLSAVRPRTVGQAARISGVSPADVSILLVQLGR